MGEKTDRFSEHLCVARPQLGLMCVTCLESLGPSVQWVGGDPRPDVSSVPGYLLHLPGNLAQSRHFKKPF